jgi:hypothetical protein
VTPKDLPQWSQVNALEAHPFEEGGLYLAATRYKLDDVAPYLFRTTDWGTTWTRIDAGIPRDPFTRVVRADPDRRGLLYAGTERGVYVSFDDGAAWQPLQLKLPIVPITDLAVKDQDLIAATQGRGFWILDDLSPLHQVKPELGEAPAHLYAPRPAYRLGGERNEEPRGMGKNPPPGVLFHYYLEEEPPGDAEVKLEILEADGDLIRTYTRKPKQGEDEKKEDAEEEAEEDLRQLPAEKGGNRFAWDLSYPPAERFPKLILWNGDLAGPTALPGSYQARLTVGLPGGAWSATVPFEIVPDPRSSTTAADLKAQFEFLVGVRDKLSQVHREIRRLREVRGQIEGLTERLGKGDDTRALRDAGKALSDRLTAVEEALYQTKNRSRQDPLNFPIRLNDKLAALLDLGALGEAAPTAQMLAVRDELAAAIDAELAKLAALWADDLPAFNEQARAAQVPALILSPAEP